LFFRAIIRTNYFLLYWVLYVPVIIFVPDLEKFMFIITVVMMVGM